MTIGNACRKFKCLFEASDDLKSAKFHTAEHEHEIGCKTRKDVINSVASLFGTPN